MSEAMTPAKGTIPGIPVCIGPIGGTGDPVAVFVQRLRDAHESH